MRYIPLAFLLMTASRDMVPITEITEASVLWSVVMIFDYKTLASVISLVGTMARDDVISKKLAGHSGFWKCSLQTMVGL